MLTLAEISPDNVLSLESDLGNEQEGFNAALAELQHPDAKKFAIAEAAKNGLPNATLVLTHAAPYPVDQDGKTIEDGNPPAGTLFRYRIDVKVSPAA